MDDYYEDSPVELVRQFSIQGAEILDIKGVINVIYKDIQELQEELYLSEDNTFELLMHFNWNREETLQKYFNDQEALLKYLQQHGIYNNHEKITYNNHQGKCGVCFCDGNLIQLGCTHRFCESCVEQTIKQRFSKDKFLIVKCLQNSCKYRLPFSMIKKYSNLQEFENLLSRRFVDSSRNLAYCTGVNCDKILKLTCKSIKEVTCICDNKFCFNCKEDLHPPCPCDLVQKWLKEIKQDEANIKWILINTKQCPFCKRQVERSEGCNFMVCKPPGGCSQSFCYVCQQPWEPDHKDHFKCNKYVPQNVYQEIDQEFIQRYNFYYEKFLNSSAAKEKAMKRIIQIRNTYNKLIFEYYQITYVDFQFLEEIMKELVQSRVVLKWSYCIGYYLSNENQRSAELFEHYQEQFEHACELLAISLIKLFDEIDKQNEQQQIDKPIDVRQKEFINLKEKIQNASLVCIRMRQNLERAISQGDIIM
ncbi:unnamed protein product [Paramecium sonneborni]|uniref:RBR-type E3 ubiquitin transferase n=1 Tax=Paramecium sonneborni TaxID=65129 RepID=A0A8S1R915_9CILI|nr:unnamed protein product [Paramecium sonneborni]